MKKLVEFIPLRRNIKRLLFNKLISLNKLPSTKISSVGLITLLCHQHVVMYEYCLDTLFSTYDQHFPIDVIDDGSLTNEDYSLLKKKYDAKIYTKEDVLKQIMSIIENYADLTTYFMRKDITVKKMKIAGILLSANKRVLLEPDILFLSKSSSINNWINGGNQKMYLSWDSHVHSYLHEMYLLDISFRKLIIHTLGLQADYSFNGGMIFLPHKVSKNELMILDKACKLFTDIEYIDNPWCEEVLLMLLTDTRYDISLNPNEHKTIWSYEQYYKTPKNPKLLHYAGDTKGIMEKDGIKYLLKKSTFF